MSSFLSDNTVWEGFPENDQNVRVFDVRGLKDLQNVSCNNLCIKLGMSLDETKHLDSLQRKLIETIYHACYILYTSIVVRDFKGK